MIGYILEKFVNSLDGLVMSLFMFFVVLPIVFLIFFVSVVYAAQAFGYYLIIRNETYLRRGWSFTYADIITEDGVTSKLCWFTEQRSYTHSFHDFSYDDTLPILYKTKRTKKFIRCDEKYWHDKMCARCVIAMLFGIMILLLIIFGF